MNKQEYKRAIASAASRFTEWDRIQGWVFLGFPADESRQRLLGSMDPEGLPLPVKAKSRLGAMLSHGVSLFSGEEPLTMITIPDDVTDSIAFHELSPSPVVYDPEDEPASYTDSLGYDDEEDEYYDDFADLPSFNPDEHQDAHPLLSSVYKKALPVLEEWFEGFVLVLFVAPVEGGSYADCDEVVLLINRLPFRHAAHIMSRWVVRYEAGLADETKAQSEEDPA